MKTVVEDLGGSQKKLVFDIPPEDVDEEIEKYCKKLAKEVDVRGFRKGKAPASVIKRYFKQQINGEVASQLVSSSFEKALEEHSLTPLGEPDIDTPTLEEGKGFPFSITLDVKPALEVKDYQGIEIEQEPQEVKDEEVQTSLEELQKAHAELKGIEEDRPAGEGDVALVDYEGIPVEGTDEPESKKEDVYIEIGSGNFTKDVEDALIGAKVGDTREVAVEYPESFMNKNLAGKKIPYRFNLKKIMVKELPSLDNEFAKDVGPYETIEDLTSRMKEEILREKKVRARRDLEEKLMDTIIERNVFEAPQSLVKSRHAQMMVEARTHFLSKGLMLDQDSEDSQKMDAEFEKLAEKEVKKHLLLETIAEKESITVSDEDVDKEIETIAAAHGQNVEKIRADIQKQEDGIDRFKQSLLRQKTLDFLMPQDTIIDKEE